MKKCLLIHDRVPIMDLRALSPQFNYVRQVIFPNLGMELVVQIQCIAECGEEKHYCCVNLRNIPFFSEGIRDFILKSNLENTDLINFQFHVPAWQQFQEDKINKSQIIVETPSNQLGRDIFVKGLQ